MTRLGRTAVVALLTSSALAVACSFGSAYRDVPDPASIPCVDGTVSCGADVLVRCEGGKRVPIDDCGARGQVCAPSLLACAPCLPNGATCDGQDVMRCAEDGQSSAKVDTCDGERGIGCRRGACVPLCVEAAQQASNVGCEYWAVDLDNAVTSQGNAAAQQYAVVVSNVDPDIVATVTVEEDTAAPGSPNAPRTVATARVGPRSLEVFRLGPKEVDGSPSGTFDTGTHTALSRGAYRIKASIPIVAYQFNPLENTNVFSNEAALLLPTAALGNAGSSYVIAGWPQTIARSEDPATNFGTDLRAFLTIVGTAPDTRVHVETTARIVPGGPLASGAEKGSAFDVVLQPFEVLNLETGDFNADFTGSRVDSTSAVAVFSGSEASDAPFYATLASRYCCADHLEEQVVPLRSVGKRYVLGRMPNRSRAIAAAGGAIGPYEEPEYYRVVATAPGKTTITTTLPKPQDRFELAGPGKSATIAAYQDFVMTASEAVLVADVQASQEAAGVVRGLPGGDPSLTFVPPVEQWRNEYVLLTPDKYAFDYVVITAPFGSQVFLDGLPIDGTTCELAPGDGLDAATRKAADPPFSVYRCQLSFPLVDPLATAPNNVLPGRQNDGVHRIQSDYPVGVVVYGFDSFVSYAYAGGTELRTLSVQ